MAGELNGTDIAIAVDVVATPTDIGGVTTQSMTLNNELVPITNKSSASWREFIPTEGIQSIDISVECIFSSDAAFVAVKTLALSKAADTFTMVRGGDTLTGEFLVQNWSETHPDGAASTASFTVVSTGAITGL